MSTVIPIHDTVLVQQLALGDRNVFEQVYRKYWRPMLDVAWKALKDKHTAEDLVQGVFLSLWQKREQLHINNIDAYLRTAVRYKVLNHVARTKKTQEFFEPFCEIFRQKDTPETELLAKNLRELVHAYAATLPQKRREIFLLYLQSRLSTKEIAEALGISQKTVQNQLGITLQDLRGKIIPLIACLVAAHF